MATDVVKSAGLFPTNCNSWNNGEDRRCLPERIPGVNIVESKDEYVVSMAVPGMKTNNFRIDLDTNILTIAAKKEEGEEEIEQKYKRKENGYSSFHRSFTLPNNVKRDEIQATYDNGMLWLLVPKKESVSKAVRKKTS